MQGPSHVGFALAGGVTITSAVSFFLPRPLPGPIEEVVHAVGTPWGYPALLHWLHSPGLNLTGQGMALLAHKLTFYLLLAWCARLPDQMERRGDEQPALKHRGFTHSCLLLFLLVLSFSGLSLGVTHWLATRHLVLTDFWARECSAGFLAIVLACLLHMVADSMTTRGIRAMWPDENFYKLPGPRFSNGRPGEYLVLWGYIFLTGVLVGLGIFGF